MIRQLQDMTGVDPLTVPLTDRKVLSIFNGIEALDIKDPDYKFKHGSYAIPEFGTSFVRQMLDDTSPTSLPILSEYPVFPTVQTYGLITPRTI